nr:ATP-dependent helicase [Brachybacterium sillae]
MTAPRALDAFQEPTRRWFRRALGEPTAAQEEAWRTISRGDDTLVIAPTGSGKTLAAFLTAIDRLLLARPDAGDDTAGTRVLYVSPLKALGADVQRNLRSPLVGIEQTAAAAEVPTSRVTVGIRTGDTPPAERRRLVATPPDILITTPESLFLMLSSAARETLTTVETVIVDEIHAVAASKRGVHLALSLARLDELVTRRGHRRAPQRIGLSATVEPAAEIAAFLGSADGRPRPTIVRPPSSKRWELSIRLPIRDFAAIGPPEDASEDEAVSGTIWPHVERAVLEKVLAHRSTIVFVNSRRQAERLTSALNRLHTRRLAAAAEATGGDAGNDAGDGVDDLPGELARAHHGSMSKERRHDIEEQLKSGDLRCVVATNSLELGIDMGAVDLVVQVETPPSVASLLQRVGRAGHSVGDVSRGVLHPLHPTDVLRAAVTVREALAGRIEPVHIPHNALDVLAQHTVSAALEEDLPVEDWFARVRTAYPYAALPRSAFDAVIDLLTGRYPSTAFSDLRPRLVLDRDTGVLQARPGAQRVVVTSGGTIPDRGLFPVYLVTGAEDDQAKRVGELDEEMVYESRRGDVITLGTSSWRIEEITHDRVNVSPALGMAGKIPFWHGDGAGRPVETGRRIAAFMDDYAGTDGPTIRSALAGTGLDENAARAVATLLSDQLEATGAVPGEHRLVVERFRDELGDWRLVLHCPLGQRITGPWALAIQARVEERFGLDGQVMAADDGIVLRLPYGDEPPGADLLLLDPEEADRIVRERIGGSALFAARFREAAARALLLPRRDPNSRSPLWQQRQKSAQLLETASPYPQFPIMLEAARECLQDVYDLPALLDVLGDIRSGRTTVVEAETPEPSPLARSLLFGYLAQFIYDSDAPLAERRAAALALDPGMLAELLGTTSLRELLDAEVIDRVHAQLQGLDERSRLSSPEQLADALRRLGPLRPAEIARRTADDVSAEDLLAPLQDRHRVVTVRLGGEERIAVVEDAAVLRDGLGVMLPPGIPRVLLEPVTDAADQVVHRWARTRGPFTAQELTRDLALAPSLASMLLERLAVDGRLQRGEFTPGRDGEEWVDPEVLTRIRRASLAATREAIAPADPAAYALLLGRWQHVEGTPLRGADGLLTAIDQLAGVTLPMSVWESQVLPARVRDMSPGLLDGLLASGEVSWTAHGRLGTRDAHIRLHLTEALPLSLDPEQLAAAEAGLDPEGLPARVLTLLRSTPGALRAGEIQQALHETSEDPPTGTAIGEALTELALASLVTCDSLALPRQWVTGHGIGAAGGGAARTTAPSRAGARRLSRRGAARLSAAVLRDPSLAAGGGVGGPAAADRASGGGIGSGRWSAVRVDPLEPGARSVALATLLLDRHAILTRGAFTVEDIPGSFAAVYRTLAAMEDSGAVRRGYFLDGLGASQFAATEAVNRLRDAERELRDTHRRPTGTVLATTDPANPYGAALPWPELPQDAPGSAAAPHPARRAGALVVLVDGRPAAVVDRGGKSLLWWADAEHTALTARLLVEAVGRRAVLPRLSVERINGAPLDSPAAAEIVEQLQAAGAYRSPRSLRVRAGDLPETRPTGQSGGDRARR